MTKNVIQYENSSKNRPRKISESIHTFFWFLHETGRAVGARVLKARVFFTFPINANFSLCMRAHHKIVNSMLYFYVG